MGNLLLQFAAQTVQQCPGDLTGGSCTLNLPQVDAAASSPGITNLLQLLFAIIAVLALFFIIMGALKFVTSQGDSQGITKARQTIIFAIIGLIVALSAEVIVTWVIGKL